jgi:two-component system nitrate/nitrite response regulator NarL
MAHAVNDDATTRIRVVLADGDRLTRLAVKETLRRHGAFVIAAEAADGDDAVRLACHYRPDLLVTEAVLTRLNGLEVVERVARQAPEVRSVLMVRDEDEELGLAALRRGASGVVCKADPPSKIVEELLAVHAGGAAIPPRLTTAVLGELRRLPEPGSGLRPVRSVLTDREWEVLDLMLAGESTADIAERLVLTRDTVASHVKNIMRKLGVHSRDALLEAGRRMLEPAAA